MILETACQLKLGGWSRKSAIQGPMLPAVLLRMRYWPPPMLFGALFQKPSERLLTKHAASSALRARTRSSGTMMLSRQLSQNLLLKCSLPGRKSGVHPAPQLSWSCAPQH